MKIISIDPKRLMLALLFSLVAGCGGGSDPVSLPAAHFDSVRSRR
jgi:hypothetical protein